MPFCSERGRFETAKSGLELFRQSSDAVMVMENDRLLTMAPDLPIEQAFLRMDKLIVERIGGMMEMMALPSKLLETQKVLEALPSDGMAMVECGGESSAADITCQAVDHPLLELECAIGASVTASTVQGISEVMAAGARPGGFSMPRTNVLVGTRTGPAGTGKKVVPLVSGMKAYPGQGVRRAQRPPAPAPARSLHQTHLLDGQWTALRPE
jgi:cell division protein FtsZ